jgi:hypothetical protein
MLFMSGPTAFPSFSGSEWAMRPRCFASWCLALAFEGLFGCGASASERDRVAANTGDDSGASSSSQPSDATTDDANAPAEGDGGGDADCTWTLGLGVPQGPAPTLDNSADLTGADFGTDTFDSAEQRRTVPVDVTGSLPQGISLGMAYLTAQATTDMVAYLILPVTNSGTDFPCFIQTTTYNWLSVTGQVLNSGCGLYIDGSVGAISPMVNSETCLAPGESGYLTDVQFAASGSLFSEVASIQLGLVSASTGSSPDATLQPTRYDVGTCSGVRTVRVVGTAGGAGVSVGESVNADLAPTIFLDAAGLPIRWSYLTQMQSSNVAAGETTYFVDDLSEPEASRARVFLPFEPADPSLALMSLPANLLHEVQAMRVARQELAQRWQHAVDSASNGRGLASRLPATVLSP